MPAGRMKRLGRMGEGVIVCSRVALPVKHVAQAAARAHAQSLVDAGAAQVGIDQQDADAFLRQHDGRVDAGRGLAFLRTGAGDHDDFGRRSQTGEQQ